MNPYAWWLVNALSQWLEPEERDAVLGDLVEAGETSSQIVRGLLGLILRRRAALWKHWRPWLAAFGLALPCTLLLMGVSVSVSRSCQQWIHHATGLTPRPGLALLICNVSLMVAWSWTGGFLVGSLSRRTVWVSVALSCLPCAFCLARFRIESLSRFSLFLFILPAVWGLIRGLHMPRIQRRPALLLALAITALTIPTWSTKASWLPNWALSGPAWYLVATARQARSTTTTLNSQGESSGL